MARDMALRKSIDVEETFLQWGSWSKSHAGEHMGCRRDGLRPREVFTSGIDDTRQVVMIGRPEPCMKEHGVQPRVSDDQISQILPEEKLQINCSLQQASR